MQTKVILGNNHSIKPGMLRYKAKEENTSQLAFVLFFIAFLLASM